ncbi:DUF58 domain-containing protein [Rhodococcus sp. NPDC003318]|uniref:DUF58 domain-containing protein n=1 Tax=Rhodococcus sp. NPDC003318 TaxID=3364503 RepID=UPI0036CF7E77
MTTAGSAGASPSGSPLPTLRSGQLRDPELAAALRTLELTVRRRLDGVLHGEHLGLIPGPGTEPGDARMYQPGDDVRQMDWSVTARTTHPHVRQSVADRELETWLVVDLSASLDFGTVGAEKRDLAVAAAAAITYLTSGGGNRIGAIVATGHHSVRIPARGGRLHAQAMLRTIATTPHAPDGVRGDLRGAIESLRRPQRRRGLAVVISDFLGPLDWERSLRAVSGRHDLLGVEVLDPRDLELPDLGEVVLHDPETGRTREFTTTAQLRADYAAAAQEHRARVEQTLRRCGAPVLGLRTDRDWIADVVRFVAARRHSYGSRVNRVGRQ